MDGVERIQKAILLLLLGVGLFFHHGVGVEGRRVLSMEEDLELEKELKLLNKHSVKTIQLEEGDVFDCVDIYKQPAFDHPLLKDHNIQMQPSSYPSHKFDKKSTEDDAQASELPKILCPSKTVPIRRITKEDLIRMKAHSKREANHTRINYPSKSQDLIRWEAMAKIKEGVYYGTQAYINVWGLSDVLPEEWTSAQFSVRNGFNSPDYRLRNAVEAGWRVEPNLFGDNKTRIFIYWMGDGYTNTGCFNHLCPGFVQTSNKVGLGSPVTPLSTYGGAQYELRLGIYKDPSTHQWWLLYRGEPMGYWPNTLFTSLTVSASEVFWGGNAGNPKDLLSPPMGSGETPDEGYRKTAYVGNILLVDNKNTYYDPNVDDVFEHEVECEGDCCDVKNRGYTNSGNGYMIYFGGPGHCPPDD